MASLLQEIGIASHSNQESWVSDAESNV